MNIIKKFEPIFGEWYAESFIGAGSFGRVYKAYREEFGNRYYSAIKYISVPADAAEIDTLRDNDMSDEGISVYYSKLVKRITTETMLMSRLKGHSNIVSYEDSKIIPKGSGIGYDVFIRMELLESLSARSKKAPLGRDEVIKLGSDICTALEVCEAQGIIHRDIKPDNIFFSKYGCYKLGDFGIARELEKNTVFMSKKGTFNYMAPEVYRGEKYGSGCDIYSLGVVLYRLMNRSRLPFLPPAPQELTPNDMESALVRRMSGEPLPAPCDADPELARIILKACAFDPRERYKTAKEMKNDLAELSRADKRIGLDAGSVPLMPYDKTAALDHRPGINADDKTVALHDRGRTADAPVKETEEAEEEKPEKRSKKGLLIGILAACVCAAVLIPLSIHLMNKPKSDQGGQAAQAHLVPTESSDPAPTEPYVSYSRFYDPNDTFADLAWKKDGDKNIIVLSDEQWDQVKAVYIDVLYDDGEGYIDLGYDEILSPISNGTLTADFDWTWLCIDGYIVPFYFSEEAYTGMSGDLIGTVSCLISYETASGTEQSMGHLRIIIDSEGRAMLDNKILIYPDEGDSYLMAIPIGAKIEPICDYYSYQGYYDIGHCGDPFIYDGKNDVAYCVLDRTHCLASYLIIDKDGHYHYSQPIP